MSKNSENPAKASMGYTIGNYLLKGIGFATVPIFTRILSQEDFGIYNTFLAYESILYIFICLALHSSLKNAYTKFEDKFDDYVSSICLLPIVNTIIVGVVFFAFQDKIGDLLKIDPEVILWLVMHSYCSGVVIFYSSKISLSYNYKEYIKVSLFNALGNVVVSIALIFTVFTEKKYMGRIVGSTLVYALVAVYIIFRIFKARKPKFNWPYMSYALKISLPIIPHGLAQIILLQFDRIMINAYIGSREAAIYSFSYSIYSIVQITANSLSTVFEPWFFKKMKENADDRLIINKVGTGIVLIIAIIICVLIIMSPEAILILGGEKYKESFYCLIPVLIAGFFAMAYTIPSVVEYYYEKTKYIAIGTTIAATLNAVLNLIFIPRFGYVAAAYTTLICYIVYFVLHMIISRRLYNENIVCVKDICFFAATIIVSSLLSFTFENNVLARISCLLLIALVDYFFLCKRIGKDLLSLLVRQTIKR